MPDRERLPASMAAAAPNSATPRPSGARPDRPLSGDPHPRDRLHPSMYASEFLGTALLLFAGLSLVVALWGHDGPLAALPLSPPHRRLVNGFLFGAVGAAIAYSPIGRVSGAHINPAMTLAFWLERKMQWRDAGFYIAAQILALPSARRSSSSGARSARAPAGARPCRRATYRLRLRLPARRSAPSSSSS